MRGKRKVIKELGKELARRFGWSDEEGREEARKWLKTLKENGYTEEEALTVLQSYLSNGDVDG